METQKANLFFKHAFVPKNDRKEKENYNSVLTFSTMWPRWSNFKDKRNKAHLYTSFTVYALK